MKTISAEMFSYLKQKAQRRIPDFNLNDFLCFSFLVSRTRGTFCSLSASVVLFLQMFFGFLSFVWQLNREILRWIKPPLTQRCIKTQTSESQTWFLFLASEPVKTLQTFIILRVSTSELIILSWKQTCCLKFFHKIWLLHFAAVYNFTWSDWFFYQSFSLMGFCCMTLIF